MKQLPQQWHIQHMYQYLLPVPAACSGAMSGCCKRAEGSVLALCKTRLHAEGALVCSNLVQRLVCSSLLQETQQHNGPRTLPHVD